MIDEYFGIVYNTYMSLDQIVIDTKVSVLAAEDYLGERAKRGSRVKFERALAKVADVEPEEYDRL